MPHGVVGRVGRLSDLNGALASMYANLFEHEEAVRYFKRALEMSEPRQAWRWRWQLLGERQMIADWRGRAQSTRRFLDEMPTGPATSWDAAVEPMLVDPHVALYLPIAEEIVVKICQRASAARAFRARAVHPMMASRASFVSSQLQGVSSRLRVAYMSADFRRHSIGTLVQALFRHHDRSRLHVHALAIESGSQRSVESSAERMRIREGVEEFISVSHSFSDGDAARMVNGLGVHILIDLNGHTNGHRLGMLALQPAAVQVHYMGGCSTIGAAFITHAIYDRITAPPDYTQWYSEKLVLLPRHYLVSSHGEAGDAPYSAGSAPSLTRLLNVSIGEGSDRRLTWFGSTNALQKLDPETFALWLDLLSEREQTRLWISSAKPRARERLIKYALRKTTGRVTEDPSVGPSPQAIAQKMTVQRVSAEDSAAAFASIDVALDSLQYTGLTTSLDLLWQGVPIVTSAAVPGRTRVTSSMLVHMGCPLGVARDAAEYRLVASTLAASPAGCPRPLLLQLASRRSQRLFAPSGSTIEQLEAECRSARPVPSRFAPACTMAARSMKPLGSRDVSALPACVVQADLVLRGAFENPETPAVSLIRGSGLHRLRELCASYGRRLRQAVTVPSSCFT